MLEVFNSDAPPQHRKAAIEQCFAEDGLSVAPLRAGKRPTAQQGAKAVESIVAASERLTEAVPSIRVFMESGDEAESDPDPAHPTLVLDVYAAGSAPGLAAVVKGTHTGKPFSPIKGVPPAKPNKKAPAKLQNDPEAVTVTLNEAGQLSKLSVAAIKGGKGFSGPVGFYLQMGGDPSKLPKA